MSHWLLKTEPGEYSWADLVQEKATVWDGVKAGAAVKNIKRMQPGDQAFIYHTGKERRIVGIAEISSLPYWDSAHREWRIKVSAREELPATVSLKMIKASGQFEDWELVRLPRLSVVPVNQTQWKYVLEESRGQQ
ncbi:MAG: EVE domain-containing protein [Syntrophomonadaceae bacterium]|nr:EVE domain-containing protein [Syntrophomonadaceae bacterium]